MDKSKYSEKIDLKSEVRTKKQEDKQTNKQKMPPRSAKPRILRDVGVSFIAALLSPPIKKNKSYSGIKKLVMNILY